MPRDWIDSDTARALLTPEDRLRLDRYVLHDAGAGVDIFGVSRAALGRGLAAGRFVHRHVVRARSWGHAHLPAEGGAVLAVVGLRPNLPQIMSLIVDVFVGARVPRLVRTLIDERWTAAPYAGNLTRELGQVPNLPSNADALLSAGHLLGLPIHDLEEVGYDHQDASMRSSIQGSFTIASCLDWATRYEVPIIPVVLSVSSTPAESEDSADGSLRARSAALGRRALERALFGTSRGAGGRRRLDLVYGSPLQVAPLHELDADDGRIATQAALQRALSRAQAQAQARAVRGDGSLAEDADAQTEGATAHG